MSGQSYVKKSNVKYFKMDGVSYKQEGHPKILMEV
jgi:hypothetical protein